VSHAVALSQLAITHHPSPTPWPRAQAQTRPHRRIDFHGRRWRRHWRDHHADRSGSERVALRESAPRTRMCLEDQRTIAARAAQGRAERRVCWWQRRRRQRKQRWRDIGPHDVAQGTCARRFGAGGQRRQRLQPEHVTCARQGLRLDPAHRAPVRNDGDAFDSGSAPAGHARQRDSHHAANRSQRVRVHTASPSPRSPTTRAQKLSGMCLMFVTPPPARPRPA
jgi:hypothetical protein